MKTKKLYQNICLSFLSVLIIFFAIEIGARVYAKIFQKQRLIIYDNVLGWKLIPHVQKIYKGEEEPYEININSSGFRDKEHSYSKPDSIFRIIVLGDSFVFGSGGVPAHDRFTELLEKSHENVEVLNMGIPGFSLDQEYLLFKTKGLKFQPDMVILCLFTGDFTDAFVPFNNSIGRPKGYLTIDDHNKLKFNPPHIAFSDALSQYSYLLGIIENKFRIFSRSDLRITPADSINFNQKKQAVMKLLIEFQELCRKNNIELIVVSFPAKWENKSNDIQDILDELTTTRNFYFLDFKLLFDKTNFKSRPYFQRDIHFNKYGHQFVATALEDFLQKFNNLKKNKIK